jgi:hypothetical protein
MKTLLFILLLFPYFSCFSQTSQIHGLIIDTNNNIKTSSVTIELRNGYKKAMSTNIEDSGVFKFSNLTSGRVIVINNSTALLTMTC